MQQLSSLQSLRAIAAIMVVIFHIEIFFLPDRLYDGSSANILFRLGYSGVEFFFALSGFIMMYIHQKDFGQADRVSNFFKKRAVRVYPLYWLVLTALLVASVILPGIGPEEKPGIFAVFHNYSLLPLHTELALEVSWTLQHEILFYLFFGLVIISAQIGFRIMTIWFSACAFSLFFPIENHILSVILSPYNLIFLGGMIAAICFKKLQTLDAYFLIAAGLALFICTGLADLYKTFPLNNGWRTVGLGLGASLTIAGLVAAESYGKIKTPDWLNKIGDSSYALYLIHLPVLTAAIPIIRKLELQTMLSPIAMLVFLTLGCIIAGLLTHFIIEKPLIRQVSKFFFDTKTNILKGVINSFPFSPSRN